MIKEIKSMLMELKPKEDFSNSEAYMDDELLDSFDIISLVSMLEEKFGIIIDGLDIVPENFQSIDDMVRLVEKSKKA